MCRFRFAGVMWGVGVLRSTLNALGDELFEEEEKADSPEEGSSRQREGRAASEGGAFSSLESSSASETSPSRLAEEPLPAELRRGDSGASPPAVAAESRETLQSHTDTQAASSSGPNALAALAASMASLDKVVGRARTRQPEESALSVSKSAKSESQLQLHSPPAPAAQSAAAEAVSAAVAQEVALLRRQLSEQQAFFLAAQREQEALHEKQLRELQLREDSLNDRALEALKTQRREHEEELEALQLQHAQALKELHRVRLFQVVESRRPNLSARRSRAHCCPPRY